MNGSIFGEAVLGVIQLKLGSWFRKYPQRKQYETYMDKECTDCE